jgi:hypothetical protein
VALRRVRDDLAALLRDAQALKLPAGPLARLTQFAATLDELLLGDNPDEAKVHAHYEGIVAALRELLGLPEAPVAGGGREGFWK